MCINLILHVCFISNVGRISLKSSIVLRYMINQVTDVCHVTGAQAALRAVYTGHWGHIHTATATCSVLGQTRDAIYKQLLLAAVDYSFNTVQEFSQK